MDTRVILGFIGGSYQHHGPGFCDRPFFSFSGVSRFLMKQSYTQHELLFLDSRVAEDPSCWEKPRYVIIPCLCLPGIYP